ncbi:MAG: trypsin-like peptidase domain-containing protein [Deltaproteobacteria bacterium]|nr:trypsin-like peptidase domain-containing protein [Deltaproteobacteria bacterium]
MGTEKMSGDNDMGKNDPTPSTPCPKNFKPWIVALVAMALLTLGWAVYEKQKRGGDFGRFFRERTWEGKVGSPQQSALNTAAVQGSANALQNSYHGIIERVRPAVISIDAGVQDPNNANPGDPTVNYNRIGSGFIIDPRGYALSSLHVVAGATVLKATVYGQGGASEYPLKVVKADSVSDLVLLRIQGDGPFPHADLGDSNAVRTGDIVLSLGSPYGFEQSVTSGIISSRNRALNIGGKVYEGLIQTDSSINRGSSGGPLINDQGEVIGINTAIYSPSGTFSGVSFTVPINRSLDLVGGVLDFKNVAPPVAGGQLAAWGRSARQIGNAYRLQHGQVITPPHLYRGVCVDCHPQLRQGIMPTMPSLPNNAAPRPGVKQVWGPTGPCYPVVGPNNLSLGISVIDVDDVIANQNNMVHPGGVVVNSLIPGLPGEAAGLQRGDVIIRVDGRKIIDGNDFQKVLEAKNRTRITLQILRSGSRTTVKVKMAPGTGQAVAGTPIKQPTTFTWLGADIKALPPDKAGVSIVEVEGVLAGAGIKAGDVIKGVNNTPVTDMNSFIELTTKANVKKGILLDIIRSGAPLYITVKDKLAQNQIAPSLAQHV